MKFWFLALDYATVSFSHNNEKKITYIFEETIDTIWTKFLQGAF